MDIGVGNFNCVSLPISFFFSSQKSEVDRIWWVWCGEKTDIHLLRIASCSPFFIFGVGVKSYGHIKNLKRSSDYSTVQRCKVEPKSQQYHWATLDRGSLCDWVTLDDLVQWHTRNRVMPEGRLVSSRVLNFWTSCCTQNACLWCSWSHDLRTGQVYSTFNSRFIIAKWAMHSAEVTCTIRNYDTWDSQFSVSLGLASSPFSFCFLCARLFKYTALTTDVVSTQAG